MLLNRLHSLVRNKNAIFSCLRRNYGVTAVALQKTPTDPIQKLFVDKIREYSKKSKSAGTPILDSTPEVEKDIKTEMEKIERQYGGGAGKDLTQFPTFTFKEPTLDSVNLEK